MFGRPTTACTENVFFGNAVFRDFGADVVDDRKVTSWPSIRTDLENAGAEVVDEEVVVDDKLITSRKPDDIPAFTEALIRSIEER